MNRSSLIVASHRLPITVQAGQERVSIAPSSGGLVAALSPIVEAEQGTWVGAAGTSYSPLVDDAIERYSLPFSLQPVYLTDEQRQLFYKGFSNEILWPLFHDLPSRCHFSPEYWNAYRSVNEQFAAVIASIARPDDVIWVHDYHLTLVAEYLELVRTWRSPISYFQHIPFPEPGMFAKLPWRTEIMVALTKYDLVLFQTETDADHFLQCAGHYCQGVVSQEAPGHTILNCGAREFIVSTLPIGIDFDRITEEASSPAVVSRAFQIKREFAGQQLALGLDRLDYTKGVELRLEAFRHLLRQHPELHQKVSLLQITIPSRETIAEYAQVRLKVEDLICQINDEFATDNWVPVQYMYQPLSRLELLSHYRAADIALVTPIKDGMNLVSKEYCAAKSSYDGVLILSEFAGSSTQLGSGALLVNPFDICGIARALFQALLMEPAERAQRMAKMRAFVQSADIRDWYARFRMLVEIARAQSMDFSVSGSASEIASAADLCGGRFPPHDSIGC